jgi:hypothetical protein
MCLFPPSPKVCIPEIGRVFRCVSAKLLFEEFPQIKLQLWLGHFWSEGYAVRTAGVVTSQKSKNTLAGHKRGCSPRKGRVVHCIIIVIAEKLGNTIKSLAQCLKKFSND